MTTETHTTTESITNPEDVTVGDTVDISGKDYLPKSNLEVVEVNPEWAEDNDGRVFVARIPNRSNARDYCFKVKGRGSVVTTNSRGVWDNYRLDATKIVEVDEDETCDRCGTELPDRYVGTGKCPSLTCNPSSDDSEDDTDGDDADIWSDANEADRRLLGDGDAEDDDVEPLPEPKGATDEEVEAAVEAAEEDDEELRDAVADGGVPSKKSAVDHVGLADTVTIEVEDRDDVDRVVVDTNPARDDGRRYGSIIVDGIDDDFYYRVMFNGGVQWAEDGKDFGPYGRPAEVVIHERGFGDGDDTAADDEPPTSCVGCDHEGDDVEMTTVDSYEVEEEVVDPGRTHPQTGEPIGREVVTSRRPVQFPLCPSCQDEDDPDVVTDGGEVNEYEVGDKVEVDFPDREGTDVGTIERVLGTSGMSDDTVYRVDYDDRDGNAQVTHHKLAPHEPDVDDALMVSLSVYGQVEPGSVAVTVEDDPETIGNVIDRAHRRGYVVDKSEDATEDARPVKRRLSFVPVDESDVVEEDPGELVADGGEEVDCTRCGDTGEVVKMVDGRSGMVPCPDCNQSPHDCEVCGKDLDRDEVVAVGPSTPAARHLGVDDVFGDFVPVCDPCFEDASEAIERGESEVVPDGGTILDEPAQSDEEIASSIVAAGRNDRVDVWVDDDGEREVHGGVVGSKSVAGTTTGGTHVVAIDTYSDPSVRMVLRFTRRIRPDDGFAFVDDAVLFNPKTGDRLTVDRVEIRD